MEFGCEAPFVVEPPPVRQHFLLFLCVVAPRVYWTKKILASFFLEFLRTVGNGASPPDICACGEWFCHRLAAASRSVNALAFALFFSANSFECAVLCWSVSDERGEVHLAGD